MSDRVAEPPIVVEHREHLWWLLADAAKLEHGIMCQYLYAAFSLKAPAGGGAPGGARDHSGGAVGRQSRRYRA